MAFGGLKKTKERNDLITLVTRKPIQPFIHIDHLPVTCRMLANKRPDVSLIPPFLLALEVWDWFWRGLIPGYSDRVLLLQFLHDPQ